MIPIKIMGFAIMTALVFYPFVAFAYVGPGAGLTLIGSLIGAVVAIVLALGAILLWPLRRLIRKFRPDRHEPEKHQPEKYKRDKHQDGKS